MADLLNVQGLETQFRTREGIVHAVNGVSFQLKKGETLGIVGESGCGKSVSVLSMLRLIPTPPGKIVSGRVMYQGKDMLKMTDEEIRHVRGSNISMVFQDPMTSLNPVMRIGQQVSEPLVIHDGLGRKQAYDRATEILELVKIPKAKDRLNDYPHQFSGGMRQRVVIAMGLICNPQILIADEPSSSIDEALTKELLSTLRTMVDEEGMTVVVASHDPMVLEWADVRHLLHDGQIVT